MRFTVLRHRRMRVTDQAIGDDSVPPVEWTTDGSAKVSRSNSFGRSLEM